MVSLLAGGAMLVVPTMNASAAAPPTAYGANAQGKAIHANYNAVASVDPAIGSTRAFASVNPDQSPPVQLGSYGYANDPGTLAGAVIFAPGNPTTPANFPGLAEAFYPEPDQEHVAKCAANTDATNATGSQACDQANAGNWYALADVQPKNPLGPSSLGYTSTQGATLGNGVPLTANQVTSKSQIVPDQDGNLSVVQENKGHDISIPGTPITISSFEASSHLKATTDAVTGDAVCTINMNIGGNPVPTDQVAAALAALPQAPAVPGGPGFTYAFTPPSQPVIAQDAIGGTASCTGAILEVTDLTTASSVTYTFGETLAQAAKLGQTLGNSSGSGSSDSGSAAGSSGSTGGSAGFTGSDSTSSSASPSSGSLPSSAALSSDSSTAASPSDSSSGAAPATASAPSQSAPQPSGELASGPRLIKKKLNATPVGLVTALGTSALLAGIWLLVSSVAGLGRRGIRLAGWQMRA